MKIITTITNYSRYLPLRCYRRINLMELIDIFDINQSYIGVIDREDAHRMGLWHKSFHCWILTEIEDVPCLIFQLRSKKRNFPDFLDISVAGHFGAGENEKDLVREIEEELGMTIGFDSLNYLGQRLEVVDFKEIKNREFQSVYIVQIDNFIELLEPNIDEVAGVYWLPIEKCLELFSTKEKHVKINGIDFNETNNSWEKASKVISKSFFIPRKDNYFLTISIMAQRLNSKIFPISI